MRDKELRLRFERKQVGGKFVTKTRIVLAKREHKLKRGVLHSIDHMMKSSFEGDVPNVTKAIDSFQPKTAAGKVFKSAAGTANIAAHKVGRTALNVGLAAETLGTETTSAAIEGIKAGGERLAEKYKMESNDDVNKAILTSGKLILDAKSGIKSHLSQRSEAKFLKKEYKLKAKDLSNFKKHTFTSHFKSANTEPKDKKLKFKEIRKNYLKARKSLKTDSVFLDKSANVKAAKAEFKSAKPKLVINKVGEYGAKNLALSAQQKAFYADERNDTVKAAESILIVYSNVNKKTISHLSKSKDNKIRRLEKKSEKLEKRSEHLERKGKAAKSKKVKNKNLKKSNAVSEKNIKVRKTINKYKMTKSPIAIFSSFSTSTMIMLIVAMLIITLVGGVLQSIFGNSGWIMGTYTAQDKYLTQAEEYYTKLAWEMNEDIIKIKSEEWKKALEELGADTSKMDDDVENWEWGHSGIYDYVPAYDFDPFKLWSFLCAYYYDFSADTSEDSYKSKAAYWEYTDDTETIIKALFDAEYKFEYTYDNKSDWVEISPYVYYGGGSGSNGASAAYYKVDNMNDLDPKKTTGNSNWTYKIHPNQYPNEIAKYLDSDGWLYFKKYNGEYRIVNCNETSSITGNWKLTPYIIPDTRFSCGDVKPFYFSKDDSHLDQANNFYFDPSGSHEYERSSRGWVNEDGSFDEAWFAIPPDNAYCWNNSVTGYWLCTFCKKYEWHTDCRLYYNVKQLKTFDNVIKDMLTAMDNGSERYSMYEMFLGTAEDSKTIRGNHQEFRSPIGESIQDYIDNGSIYNGYGYDVQAWNTHHCEIAKDETLHEGIDIICDLNTDVYAGLSGTVQDIDRDKNMIVIRKKGYNFWYDGDGNGKKRDVDIYYYNILPSLSLNKGDTVEKGEKIGSSAAENSCEDTVVGGSYYIHIKVKIDTDGYGWHFIDPRLVFE